jgi:hypothetical protein
MAMHLLGPREDRDGEITNNGLRRRLAEVSGNHQACREDHSNSANWSAELAGEATVVRAEMRRRSRAN